MAIEHLVGVSYCKPGYIVRLKSGGVLHVVRQVRMESDEEVLLQLRPYKGRSFWRKFPVETMLPLEHRPGLSPRKKE